MITYVLLATVKFHSPVHKGRREVLLIKYDSTKKRQHYFDIIKYALLAISSEHHQNIHIIYNIDMQGNGGIE